MTKIFYKLFIIAIILFINYNAFCSGVTDTVKQDAAKKDTSKEKSSFKIGVDYLSNNVFMGRTGPVTTPIISPEAKYAFKFGLYVSGTLDYLPDNKKNKLDGSDLSAGYDFDLTDDLSGQVSYTKMFYNVNSTQIGSSISSVINANFDYDIGTIITPSISADYDVNKQGIDNDYSINPGISHDIVFDPLFGSNDLLLISPTVEANIGTQNFYDAYLSKKVFKAAKRTATQDALIAKFEQNVNEFKLLDYEFSIPVEYKAGHFIFQFTPTYAIVENEFKSAAVAKDLGVTDKPSVFYFTAGIALKF